MYDVRIRSVASIRVSLAAWGVCMYGLQLQKLAGLAAALDGHAAFMIERSKVLYMGLESKAMRHLLTIPIPKLCVTFQIQIIT